MNAQEDLDICAIYEELERPAYPGFDDNGEVAVQLGFVLIFSVVVPWMCFVFLIWDVIEMRTDLFRMVYVDVIISCFVSVVSC